MKNKFKILVALMAINCRLFDTKIINNLNIEKSFYTIPIGVKGFLCAGNSYKMDVETQVVTKGAKSI